MPRRWLLYNRLNSSERDSLRKLLGELEIEVMEVMWQRAEDCTVRDVATALQQNQERERPTAYTTVMTVMTHLTEKGLLTRFPLDKKTHIYKVALTREEFLARSSQRMVDTLVADFGDLALAQFIEAVEQVDPERLEKLLKQLSAAQAGNAIREEVDPEAKP